MENVKKVEGIYKLNDELQKLIEKESDLYKKTFDDKNNKVFIERKGKEIEVTIGELFEEIRALSMVGKDATQAREVLTKIYPKLFKAVEERENKNKELQEFIVKEFGFDFKAMNLANYMKITEAMIEYKFDKMLEDGKLKKKESFFSKIFK